MFCEDICYIISTYLLMSRDVISFKNVNSVTRKYRLSIVLNSRIKLKQYMYSKFDIIKIYSTYNDYSHVDDILTNKLEHLTLSTKQNKNLEVINKIPKLINLKQLMIYSEHINDDTIKDLTQLTFLNIGTKHCKNFTGKYLDRLKSIRQLSLGPNLIQYEYVDTLSPTLRLLQINTNFADHTFNNLVNLTTLDVTESEYTLIDQNISTLVNLRTLKCKYSVISSLDHLKHLQNLSLGLNNVLKKICNPEIQELVLHDSVVEYIDAPKLRNVSLNNYITDDTISKHTNIEFLYMGTNSQITDIGIEPLTKLTHFYNNSYNNHITESGLQNKKLQYISFGIRYIDLYKLDKEDLIYVEYYDPYNLESIVLVNNRIHNNG